MRQKLGQEADSSPNTKGVALFVRDVDFSISEQRLYKEFLPFGNIISFKLIMENGRSKGYAYVTYSTEAEAKTAMNELNGKILGMKLLYIVLSKSKEELARQKNERLRGTHATAAINITCLIQSIQYSAPHLAMGGSALSTMHFTRAKARRGNTEGEGEDSTNKSDGQSQACFKKHILWKKKAEMLQSRVDELEEENGLLKKKLEEKSTQEQDGNMEIMATGDEEPQAMMLDSSTDTSTDVRKILRNNKQLIPFSAKKD
ncbi:hypothetical protein QTP86_017718 [Hemibagrus guttatus]|nr:hypothetical protein QTP86_017718 [Hemibagrus guttatus]